MVFLFSLYLQQSRGLPALAAGLAFVPMTVLTAFISPTAARFAARFGPRVPVVTGQLLMAAGLAVLSLSPASRWAAAGFHDGLRAGLLLAAFLVLPATMAGLLLRPAARP